MTLQPEIVTAADVSVAVFAYPAMQPNPHLPVLILLHGGAFNHKYFAVAGSPAGSFIEIANRNRFSVLAIDRPGYGGSDAIEDDHNTFSRQAEIVDAAISSCMSADPSGTVLLIGHSIGGMVALEIAARNTDWNLIGVSVSGMGARMRVGGAAETLAPLLPPGGGVVDLPLDQQDLLKLCFGPAGSYTADAVIAAHAALAPAPIVEAVTATTWPAQRLGAVGAAISVPVQYRLAEFDALWDGSVDARDEFVDAFSASTSVDSRIIAGVGHCIDHHRHGAALAYQQLAFAHACWCQTTSRADTQ